MIRRTILSTALLVAATGIPVSSFAGDNTMQQREVSVAMEFLAALGRLDFDAASSLLHQSAVLDLPYASDGLVVRGREDIFRFFRKAMAGSVAGIEYKLDRAYPSPDAGATVLEISTQGRTAAGQEYTNRLVGIFEFRDGKIVLFREYFNPAGMK